jgi:hypothetical protein
MSHKIQIIVRDTRGEDRVISPPSGGRWNRITSILVRLGITVLVLSVLVAALLLGSLLAIAFAVLICVVLIVSLLRVAWRGNLSSGMRVRRVPPGPGQR